MRVLRLLILLAMRKAREEDDQGDAHHKESPVLFIAFDWWEHGLLANLLLVLRFLSPTEATGSAKND
jgi:hypothetical protein